MCVTVVILHNFGRNHHRGLQRSLFDFRHYCQHSRKLLVIGHNLLRHRKQHQPHRRHQPDYVYRVRYYEYFLFVVHFCAHELRHRRHCLHRQRLCHTASSEHCDYCNAEQLLGYWYNQ